MGAYQRKRGFHRVLPAGQSLQLGQVGRRNGGKVHQTVEGGHGGVVGKVRAACCDHDRIEDHRYAVQLLQPVGDDVGREGAADHADLDRVHTKVVDHRINLRQHRLGRHRMHGRHANRVLGRDGGDRRHRMAAKHGHRLDVGLNARAAAAVGACDDEDARDGCHGRPSRSLPPHPRTKR